MSETDTEGQVIQQRERAESVAQRAEGGEDAVEGKGTNGWKLRECDVHAGMRRVVIPVNVEQPEVNKVREPSRKVEDEAVNDASLITCFVSRAGSRAVQKRSIWFAFSFRITENQTLN